MPFAAVRTASLVSSSVRGTGLSATAAKAVEKHPLFASRLCYRSEEFFWSWASSKDFCAEGDALWQWQKASATRSGRASGSNLMPLTATAVKRLDAPTKDRAEGGKDLMRRLLESRRTSSSAPSAGSATSQLPCTVHVDLSNVRLPRHLPHPG